ncbi:CTL-like protein 2 [Strongyloides ratti]|uniref:Choline transporter-like protein n=1 Tax=Strongyloides ratti TaxID=34506 RepID=A0A090KUB8_STRRB|nr:CTL-like protein 2 [Strongyloides ratti]CEF61011.1 CTL-like protein 2 [Strongyloides ratti]
MSIEKNNVDDSENLMLTFKYPNIVLTTKRRWLVVGYQAFMTNNLKRVIFPSDSAGRICGIKQEGVYDLSEKPYLLFFDLTKCASWTSFMSGCPTKQVCVKECPQKYFTYLQLRSIFSDATFYKKLKKEIICSNDDIKYNIKSFEDLKRYVRFGECIAYTVKSSPLLGRCIPVVVTNLISSTTLNKKQNLSLNEIIANTGKDIEIPEDEKFIKNVSSIYKNIKYRKGFIGSIIEDIYLAKWKILLLLTCSAIVCLIYVNALRILGEMIIWGTLSMIFIGLILGIAFCWHQYKILLDEEEIFNENHINTDMRSYFHMPNTWKYIGFRNRIKIALLIIKETNKAISKMPNILLFPFIPFILNILCFLIFGTLAIWISTSGKENCFRYINNNTKSFSFNINETCDCSNVGTSLDKNCHFFNITKDEKITKTMQFYNIFAYFWSTCFISGFHNTVIAGAIGSYYWTYNKKKDVPKNAVSSSIYRTIRYHLGSIALGSLIIALIKFIRTILQYIYNNFKGSKNKIIRKIYCLMSCWFWLLENVLKYLTTNSYIIIAIHGKPFWTSAKKAISLISQNIIRVIVVNRVSSILLFIGKLFITIFFVFISYNFFSNNLFDEETFNNNFNNYLTPVIVVAIGTYYIADLFFDVYEFGIATTFLCFLDDCERNDGSTEKPYYMNRSKKAGNMENISIKVPTKSKKK